MTRHISVRDLGRVKDISAVLARHGFGHLVRKVGLDVEGEPIESRLPLGKRVRTVLSDLGTTFVKLGQVLSVRPDLVPREVMDELQGLQDAVPPASFVDIRAVVEEELGRPLEEAFREFEETPLASASIAQVHRAVLLSGEAVAVKVQRPGIEKAIRSDVHILYSLAHLVAERVEIPGMYTAKGIVQEFDAAITQELDFLQEARAAERFRRNFAEVDIVRSPRVHTELSTRRVLVMELIMGKRLSELDQGAAGPEVMRQIVEATYLQVFEHGFFHGDPHPGNLLLCPDGRVAYLDFGLTGTLSGEMQDTLMAVFVGLVFRDAEAVALSIYRAGATEARVDLTEFRKEIERLMAKYHGASLSDLSERASLVEFIQVAARYRIRLPTEYAVLARMGSIIDGMARNLLADVDIVEEVRPYAQRLVGRRLAPERLGADALRLLQQGQILVRDVPTHMAQLMLDLQRGSLRIGAVDPEAELMREEIRHAGIRVAIAICATALGLSGAILLATWAPSPFGIPLVALVGLALAGLSGATFLLLVVHAAVAARLRPRDLLRRLVALTRFFFGSRP